MRFFQLFNMVFFFFFFQFGLVFLFLLSFPVRLFAKSGRWFYYGVVSFFLKMLLFFCFIRVRVYGRENIPREKGLIFVGNHPGLLEPMYVMGYLPVRVLLVSDEGILKIPLLSAVLRTLGCITYKMTGADPQFVVSLLSVVREGESVLIFPHSLRYADGKMRALGDALIRTAKACQATIVPFVIKQPGADAFSKGIFVTPGETGIIIGRPIRFQDFENIEMLEERFQDLMGG